MKLHEKCKMQEKLIDAYKEGIREIRSYLSLPKFYWPDNNVNVSDIFLRIEELNSIVRDIENNEDNRVYIESQARLLERNKDKYLY